MKRSRNCQKNPLCNNTPMHPRLCGKSVWAQGVRYVCWTYTADILWISNSVNSCIAQLRLLSTATSHLWACRANSEVEQEGDTSDYERPQRNTGDFKVLPVQEATIWQRFALFSSIAGNGHVRLALPAHTLQLISHAKMLTNVLPAQSCVLLMGLETLCFGKLNKGERSI